MLEVSDAGCQRSSIRAPGPKRIRRGKPLTVPPSTPRFTVPPSTPRFNVEQGFALSETGSIKPFVLSTFGGYGMPPTLNLGVRGARLGHSEHPQTSIKNRRVKKYFVDGVVRVSPGYRQNASPGNFQTTQNTNQTYDMINQE